MAYNPRDYVIETPAMQGPLDFYKQALSLRDLMDARKVRDIQIRRQQLQEQEDLEKQARTKSLTELFRTTPAPTEQQLYAADPFTAPKILEQRRLAEKAKEDLAKAALERKTEERKLTAAEKMEMLNQLYGFLELPEDQRAEPYAKWRDYNINRGYLPESMLAEPMPDEKRARSLYTSIAGPVQLEDLDEKKAERLRKAAIEKDRVAAAMLDLDEKKITAAGHLLGYATDQPSWSKFHGALPDTMRGVLSPMFSPDERQRAEAMMMTAQQRTQERRAQQQAMPNTADELIMWMNQPGRTPDEISRGKAALQQMTTYHQAIRPAAITAAPGLVDAVLQNPNLWDNLTPTAKTEIAPEIAQRGGGAVFGKPLSEGAINKLSDSRSAVTALRDLREVLKANEQYIGPLSGLQALNPYSEARKAQANIDMVRQRVGKALEGGVLRKEDEEKYKRILATLTDVPSTAIYKVDQLIETLTRDIDTFTEEQRKAGRRVGQPDPAKPKPSDIPSPLLNSSPKPATHVFNPKTGKIEAK
jgi:hypothetical protein